MICPSCRFEKSDVIDSRTVKTGEAIRRRRKCKHCGYRWSTWETSDHQIDDATVAAATKTLRLTLAQLAWLLDRLSVNNKKQK